MPGRTAAEFDARRRRAQATNIMQTTPLDLLLQELAAFAEDVKAIVSRVAVEADPVVRLQLIHESAHAVALTRSAFADAKGLACLEANEAGLSYPQIAEALGCSEPYVQQMVYRGRKVRKK